MVIQGLPETLVKVGLYQDPLSDAVKRSSEDLFEIPFGSGDNIKYVSLNKGPYFLMVSQPKDRIPSPAGYNVILSVVSRSLDRNREIADKFERETGIDLGLEVPKLLQTHMDSMNSLFGFLE
ncbi:MAG TPA: hypothetical protein ENH99_01980 [Candidatus Pacearchaeota archaeon]|uniref:Uncharacterized protein n=1 Tax=marine sediment metagenome TaxID=412755 RepID=A0A0F8ZCG9_9ZZZZ|nr:hypothetical protein [Candidatus Pacearchaeota archaeon]